MKPAPVLIPKEIPLLAEPVFNMDTIFERFKVLTIERRPAGREIVCPHWISVPVYLPEAGCLISLDTTSSDIARDFTELVFRRDTRTVIILKLYNVDAEIRRAVSWGNYSLKVLEENVYRTYSSSLFNDMVLTPSALMKGSIVSPSRSFPIESQKDHFFRCTYSYNTFVTFIDPGDTFSPRTRTLWLGKKVEIKPFRAKFIIMLPDGTVRAHNIILSFKGVSENWKPEKGYYICVAESFNSYMTSHPDARFLSGKSVNLVSSLHPLVHSPYDIVPFLSPYFLSPEQFEKLVLRFTVPKTSVQKIMGRLEKFEGRQDASLVENYSKAFEKLNGLMRITPRNSKLHFAAVNPSLVALLVTQYLHGDRMSSMNARKILERPWELIDRAESFESDSTDMEFMMAHPRLFLLDTRRKNAGVFFSFFRKYPEP